MAQRKLILGALLFACLLTLSSTALAQFPLELTGSFGLDLAMGSQLYSQSDLVLSFKNGPTKVNIPFWIYIWDGGFSWFPRSGWQIDTLVNQINYRVGLGRTGRDGLATEEEPLGLLSSNAIIPWRTHSIKVFKYSRDVQTTGYLLEDRSAQKVYAAGVYKKQLRAHDLSYRLINVNSLEGSDWQILKSNLALDLNYKKPWGLFTYTEALNLNATGDTVDEPERARALRVEKIATPVGELKYDYVKVDSGFVAPLSVVVDKELTDHDDPRSPVYLYRGKQMHGLNLNKDFNLKNWQAELDNNFQWVGDGVSSEYRLGNTLTTQLAPGSSVFVENDFYLPQGKNEQNRTAQYFVGFSKQTKLISLEHLRLGVTERPYDPIDEQKTMVDCKLVVSPLSSLKFSAEANANRFGWEKSEWAKMNYFETRFQPDLSRNSTLRMFDGFKLLVAHQTYNEGGKTFAPVNFAQMSLPIKSLTGNFVLFERADTEKAIFYQEWGYNLTPTAHVLFGYKMRGDDWQSIASGQKNAYLELMQKTPGGALYIRLGGDSFRRSIDRTALPERDWGKPWERYVEPANAYNETQRSFDVELRIYL